jgi:hypothetical protein
MERSSFVRRRLAGSSSVAAPSPPPPALPALAPAPAGGASALSGSAARGAGAAPARRGPRASSAPPAMRSTVSENSCGRQTDQTTEAGGSGNGSNGCSSGLRGRRETPGPRRIREDRLEDPEGADGEASELLAKRARANRRPCAAPRPVSGADARLPGRAAPAAGPHSAR